MNNGISKKWVSLVRRCQALARQEMSNNSSGVGIMHITFLVDSEGEVIVWTSPQLQRIEPSNVAKDLLLHTMATLKGKV